MNLGLPDSKAHSLKLLQDASVLEKRGKTDDMVEGEAAMVKFQIYHLESI